jgi:membrane metallo-endopeptidase-like protein 1
MRRGDKYSTIILSAEMMLKYIDKKADPCQDFYQYACGNWDKYNPIPDDKAGFDTFETLRESLSLVLKQQLEDPVRKSTDSYEDSAILKAKNLFRSCMNYGEYALLFTTY